MLGSPASNVGRCCLQRLTSLLPCLVLSGLLDALIGLLACLPRLYACLASLATVLKLPLNYLPFYACFLCIVPPRALYTAGAGVQHWTPAKLASNDLVVSLTWHRPQVRSDCLFYASLVCLFAPCSSPAAQMHDPHFHFAFACFFSLLCLPVCVGCQPLWHLTLDAKPTGVQQLACFNP